MMRVLIVVIMVFAILAWDMTKNGGEWSRQARSMFADLQADLRDLTR